MDHFSNRTPCPNWRDASSYDYLLTLDRAGWAGEFLRRNPRYRDTATKAIPPTRCGSSRQGSLELILTPHISIGAQDWGLFFP